MNGLPGAVLFTCNFNRVRSPMAEALMKMVYGDRVFVDSVGLRREVGEKEVDPFAAAVIDEIGGDLSDFRPKTFDDLEDESFDLVISLTPEAPAPGRGAGAGQGGGYRILAYARPHPDRRHARAAA